MSSGFGQRAVRSLKRRLGLTDRERIKKLLADPPAVEVDRIVFTSSEDYSGNPKALYLYMKEEGLLEKYRVTWLFERRENCFDFPEENVESLCMFNEEGKRSWKAQQAVMRARFVFYSHNVNWVKNFRKEQTFVDLWHGCGYKGALKSDATRVFYDYLMVTGERYIDIFRDVMDDPDGNILDLGYPRNDMFRTRRSGAAAYLASLKERTGAEKALLWMPTFRQSTVKRLDTDIALSSSGIPLLYGEEQLRQINDCCRAKGVLLIVKKHHLQVTYDLPGEGIDHVLFLDGNDLRKGNADLYELLAQTDGMITDYSSAAIDYMLLDKPLGYTLDDFDQYEDARGWSFDNVKDYMPGHHMYTMEDLLAFVGDVAEGRDPYAADRARILPQMHTYTDGFSRRIAEYFGL